MARAAKTNVENISLGSQVDELVKLREKIRALNDQLKTLDDAKRSLEEVIQGEMDVLQIDKASGKLGSVTITEQEVASPTDWDAFNAFVKRNNCFYLYQRRINNAPYRELLAQRNGKAIPGVDTVVKRTLNLRKR